MPAMSPTRRIFLRQLGLGAGGWFLLPSLWPALGAADLKDLPRSTPEAQGVSTAGILAFLDAIAHSRHALHSFMFARHGQVIAEGWWTPYASDLNHGLYSLSKSFTSTAVGFAVAEGKLTVEDKVTSFFPDDLPDPVSENLAALRVKDLLTMSVGHAVEPLLEMVKVENWAKAFLAWPIANPPGSQFLYNSGATYMLSAIVQRLAGEPILSYLTPRLFTPLGIEGMTWETCPRGINTGGWGLSLRTEALAKFGQLYLQRGQWKGQQLLPAKWIEEATTFKIQEPAPAKPTRPSEKNDWLQGYCYQFWRSTHQAYRGDGAFGQFMIVMPEQDAVVAITAETHDIQNELDLVWEHLLPAIKEAPLPADAEMQAQLQRALNVLVLNPAKAQPTSPTADRVSGKTYRLAANDLGLESVVFEFQNNPGKVTFHGGQTDYPVSFGIEKWQRGETALPGTPPRLISGGAWKAGTPAKVAASGTWKGEDTFEMTWRYIETPHHDTVTCQFTDDDLHISFLSSIAQPGKDKRPELQGRIA